MKLFNSLVLVMLITSIDVSAQQYGGESQASEERAKTFVTKMNEKIPFNRMQRDSLMIVFKSYYDEMQIYRSEGNKEVMKVLSQKRDNKVQQILASENMYSSYQKYMEEYREERRKQREQGGNEGQRGGMGGRRGGVGGMGGGGMGGMRQPGF